jgi:hypothetical protein
MTKNNTVSIKIGNIEYQSCKIVQEFFEKTVRPNVRRFRTPVSSAHDTYEGALIRTHAWLRTISKLEHPGDFQAAITASRAIFEIAVDLTLIRYNVAPYSMLCAWEESAKLAAAEKTVNYYKKKGVAIPSQYEAISNFVQSNTQQIRQLRQANWKQDKHPPRWTGHNLFVDSEQADKFTSDGFSEYYAVRYPQVCWSVHGSGLTCIRGVSEDLFPGLIAFAFSDIAKFSIIVAKQTLELMGINDSIMIARLSQLSHEIRQARRDVWTLMPLTHVLFK